MILRMKLRLQGVVIPLGLDFKANLSVAVFPSEFGYALAALWVFLGV
jgi:hypothetical protein